jgi:hypothetical protein
MDEETKQAGIVCTMLMVLGIAMAIAGVKCNRDDNVVWRDCLAKHSVAECRVINK